MEAIISTLLSIYAAFLETAIGQYFVLILGDGNWLFWLRGIFNTVAYVAAALLIGGMLSLPLALARANKHPIFDPIIGGFTYSFRGTPLLVQAFLLYYGLGQFDFIRDSFKEWPILKEAGFWALLAFILNTTAYTTEIFKGAIQAVPFGEIEAAKAAGMSKFQRTRRIILPSALRISLPAYSNEVIFMLHGSVVLGVLPIIDILGAAKTINARYYVAQEGFIPCAILYMILVFGISKIFKLLEQKYHGHLRPSDTENDDMAMPIAIEDAKVAPIK